jgi:hypothetical protein
MLMEAVGLLTVTITLADVAEQPVLLALTLTVYVSPVVTIRLDEVAPAIAPTLRPNHW